MKITYYEESDILHIQFTNQPVAKTKSIGGNLTAMDPADDGTPVALESFMGHSAGLISKRWNSLRYLMTSLYLAKLPNRNRKKPHRAKV